MANAAVDIDVSELSPEQLSALKKRIASAERNNERSRRQKAISAVHDAAKQHGFKLGDLFPRLDISEPNGSASQSAVRYRNPDNPDEVWSGRGRRPSWYSSKLSEGIEADQMLVRPKE